MPGIKSNANWRQFFKPEELERGIKDCTPLKKSKKQPIGDLKEQITEQDVEEAKKSDSDSGSDSEPSQDNFEEEELAEMFGDLFKKANMPNPLRVKSKKRVVLHK